MTMPIVKSALEDLENAFKEFREENEDRLSSLENLKGIASHLTEKVETLGNQVSQAQHQVQKMDLGLRRPLRDTGPSLEDPDTESLLHQKAFLSYIRKGEAGDLQALHSKSLSVESDPDGGYTVPTALSHHILKVLDQWSEFRKLARVTPISTDALEMLVDKEEADAGWVTETDPRGETKTPELAKIRILVHELYARPRMTQQLLEDSQLNLQEWLIQKIGEKMARLENKAFLFGSGLHQPRGLLTYPLKSASQWEWGTLEAFKTGKKGGFSEDEGADLLIEMSESLKPGYRAGATWLLSRSALAALRQLRRGETYLWQQSFSHQVPDTFLGYPVVCLEELPSLNNEKATTSVLFGNFKEAYQIVDRLKTRVLRDPYSAKPYVELYVRRRVGGDVINFEAVKALSFSD